MSKCGLYAVLGVASIVSSACQGEDPVHVLPTVVAPAGDGLASQGVGTTGDSQMPNVLPPGATGADPTPTQAGPAAQPTTGETTQITSTTADSTQSQTRTTTTTNSTASGSTYTNTDGLVTVNDATSADSSSKGETPSDDGSTTEAEPAPPDAAGPTCLELCERGSQDAFVDCVVEFKPSPATAHYVEEFETTDPVTGQVKTETRESFGFNHDKMPGVVLGPPGGAFDTVSLGCEGSLTVGFVDPPLTDGPGPDLIVFENPFAVSFPEPVRVEVSDDGCTWVEFPCNPVTLQGCGGVSVVNAIPGSGLDPTDPEVAGGDAFDLADIGVARARFVRVVSVSREYWLAKENTEKWCDPGPLTMGKGGSDIDAFAVVHASALVAK